MPIKNRVENAGNNARSRLFQNGLVRNRLTAFIWRVCLGMIRDDATHLAAGVAYYAVFSFIPLMIGFLAILGLLLNSAELQQQFLNFVTANTPGASAFAASNVQQIVKFRGILGIGGLLGLVGVGLAVFVAVSRAINRAWGIRKDRPFYINIPRQLLMTIVLGILFLLSTIATSIIQLVNNQLFRAADQEPLLDLGLSYLALYLIPTIITLAIFLLLYRFAPNRKMRWSYVWPGAVIATGLFELAKSLFIWYLENLAIYDQIYGSLASVMAFLFWAFLSSLILVLGAEVNHEYQQLYYPDDPELALGHSG